MRQRRLLKITSLIQQELGKIMLKNVDFEDAIVTIVGVEVAEDLLQANIKLGIFPYEKGPAVLDLLAKKRKELQHELLKKINIKPMPQIRFQIEEQNKRDGINLANNEKH
jgi:ribosome-binding factor A